MDPDVAPAVLVARLEGVREHGDLRLNQAPSRPSRDREQVHLAKSLVVDGRSHLDRRDELEVAAVRDEDLKCDRHLLVRVDRELRVLVLLVVGTPQQLEGARRGALKGVEKDLLTLLERDRGFHLDVPRLLAVVERAATSHEDDTKGKQLGPLHSTPPRAA